MNIIENLLKTEEKFPTNIAIIDEFGSLTYRDLFKDISLLAKTLSAKGITRGKGVGVIGKNSRTFILASLAALSCDTIVFPLVNTLKEYEIEQILSDIPLHAIIDDCINNFSFNKKSIIIEDNNLPKIRLTEINNNSPIPLIDFVNNPAFVRFTSGTTGLSKGVILSHKSVIERINAANQGLNLSEKDIILWVLPMAYHFFVSILLYLSVGATIVIAPDNLPETILNLANKYSATFFYASPLHYKMLSADQTKEKFISLKKVISTSTSLDIDTTKNFYKRFNIPVIQGYGIIEIGLPIINNDNPIKYPDSVGRAQPAYQTAIFDENLKLCPPNTPGELAIKGPGFFEAYLNPPTLLKDILYYGWFMTGDIAVQNEEGYIKIIGRSKSVINVAGNKVFPEEVESVINNYPNVKYSKVYGKTHHFVGEIVHADIVLENANNSIDKEDIIAFCRKKLSGYKVPCSLDFIGEIQMTQSGKIQR